MNKITGQTNRARTRLIAFGVCVFLIDIVWIGFGTAIHNGFVNFDDDQYVYQNPGIAGGLTPDAVRWAFTRIHASNWHPLTTISHMLDCSLYGLYPWGHHLTNILLHATAAILLFFALLKLTVGETAGFPRDERSIPNSQLATSNVWPSAFVAALFAVHPLRVESVAWISERKDVLSGVFFMLTLLAYARYARSERFSIGRYLAVVVLFALGLLCKPTLVTLPFVLLLLDYWPLRRMQSGKGEEPRANRAAQRGHKAKVRGRKPEVRISEFQGFSFSAFPNVGGLVLEKLPLFLLSAISCVVTIIAQKEALTDIRKVAFPERLANAVVSYVSYLAQTIWPAHLAVLYPYHERNLGASVVIFALLLLSFISAVVWLYRKRCPFLLVGWLWFIGTLVPMSGIVQVGWQSRADRYTYLPQIGLLLAVTWGAIALFNRSARSRQLLAVVGVFIILALIVPTRAQTSSWESSVTLWQHAVANTPNNYIAYNNLGEARFAEGNLEQAIVAYEKAIQINSALPEAEYNMANAFAQKRDLTEAIAHYQTALRIRPDYAEAEFNLGSALLQSGEPSGAIYHYEKAVELKPDSAEMQLHLADLLSKTGETNQATEHYQKAVACYQTAVRVQPKDAVVHNDLGMVLAKLEKLNEAIGEFQRALEISPNNAEAHYNMGSLLARLGRKQEAEMHLAEAVRLKPDYAEAKEQLRELGVPSSP